MPTNKIEIVRIPKSNFEEIPSVNLPMKYSIKLPKPAKTGNRIIKENKI